MRITVIPVKMGELDTENLVQFESSVDSVIMVNFTPEEYDSMMDAEQAVTHLVSYPDGIDAERDVFPIVDTITKEPMGTA